MAAQTELDHLGTALVTGGSRGIGRGIATALAETGFDVAVASRTAADLDDVVESITSAGGHARPYTADLAEPAEIDDLASAVEADMEAVDVLVNNAGIGAGGRPVWEFDADEWWRVHEVNLRAPMRLCRRLMPRMVERDAGYVINLGSLVSARQSPMVSPYATSKAALARLSDAMAKELDDRSSAVRVFTVSPGLVRTDMTRDLPQFQDLPEEAWTPVEEVGDLVARAVNGEFDALSGRFLHVLFDLDTMVDEAETIVDDGLYILRLPGLEDLVE